MSFGFFQDGTYSPERLRRIRLSIVVPSVLIIAGGVILVPLGRYELANAIGLATLVLIFASLTWWAMATKTSGPLQIDPKSIDYIRRILKGTRR